MPNPEGCVELTRGDAYCRYLFTENKRYVNAEDWSSERIGRISYSPKDVGKFINFVEQVCNRGQNCVKDWENQLSDTLKNMNIRRR